jgi:AcrR family transcriptional regulator
VSNKLADQTEIRRNDILRAGIYIVVRDGFANLLMSNVARKADVSPETVKYHFGNRNVLRREIALFAKKHQLNHVVCAAVELGIL